MRKPSEYAVLYSEGYFLRHDDEKKKSRQAIAAWRL